GEVVTLRFQVENRSSESWQVDARFNLPPGWRSLLTLERRTILSGHDLVVFLPVAVPADAAAGPHTLEIQLLGADAETTSSVTVLIGEHHEIQATVVESPPFALDGPYEVVFRLRNAGNIAE